MVWLEFSTDSPNEQQMILASEISYAVNVDGHARLVLKNGHSMEFRSWRYEDFKAELKRITEAIT